MELKKDETSFEERLAEELDNMEEIYKINKELQREEGYGTEIYSMFSVS